MFMLGNFNPLINLFLFAPVKVLISPSLANGSEKNEFEKLKISHFGQIQIHLVCCIFSYVRIIDERAVIVNPHFTFLN